MGRASGLLSFARLETSLKAGCCSTIETISVTYKLHGKRVSLEKKARGHTFEFPASWKSTISVVARNPPHCAILWRAPGPSAQKASTTELRQGLNWTAHHACMLGAIVGETCALRIPAHPLRGLEAVRMRRHPPQGAPHSPYLRGTAGPVSTALDPKH